MSDSNTTESDMSVEQGQAGGQEHAPTGEIIDQQTDNGFAPESDSNVQPEREPQFTPVAQLQPAFEGNISFASVGGTAAKRQQSGETAPSPAPGTGREPGKHGLRNFIVGGGVVGTVGALATAAAITLFGGRSSSDQQHNPDTGANGGAPTLTIKTPEATQTPTVTPEKTPDPNKIFMSDAIRKNFGDASVGFDKDYPTTTECPDPARGFLGEKTPCPSIIDIISNPSLSSEKVGELLTKAGDDLFGMAWLTRDGGHTDEEIFKGNNLDEYVQNLAPFLQEYEKAKQENGGKVRINGIRAFTEEDGYTSETSTYVESDYKVEWMYIPQPGKYTPIATPNSQISVGTIVNHDSKIVTLTIYDFSGGKGSLVNDLSIKYQTSADMSTAGVAFVNRRIQLNGKFDQVQNASQVSPSVAGATSQLLKNLGPIPNVINFQGKDYIYYEGAVRTVTQFKQ